MTDVQHGQSSGMVPEDVVGKVTEIASNMQKALVQLSIKVDALGRKVESDLDARLVDREQRKLSAEFIHREIENLLRGQQTLVNNQQQLLELATDGAARLGKLEAGQAAHSEQLNTLGERLDELDTRDLAQYEESKADRHHTHEEIAALRQQYTDLQTAIENLQQYIAPDMTPEKAREQQARYIEMIERHERLLSDRGSGEDHGLG